MFQDRMVSGKAFNLLYKACFLPEKSFLCFGIYYYRLNKLNFIDDENQVTYLGRQYIRHCIDKGRV